MQNEENLEDLYIKLVKAKLQKHWKTVGGIIFSFTTASLIVSFLLPPKYSVIHGLLIGSYQYRDTSSPLENTATIKNDIHLDDKFIIKETPPYLEISVMGNSEEDTQLKAKKTVEDIVNRHAIVLKKKKDESLITKQIKHLEEELAKEEEEDEVAKLIGRFSVDSVARAMYTIYIKERTEKTSERLNSLRSQLETDFNPTTIEYKIGPKKLSPSTAQSTTIGFLFGVLVSIFYLYFKKDPDITARLTVES